MGFLAGAIFRWCSADSTKGRASARVRMRIEFGRNSCDSLAQWPNELNGRRGRKASSTLCRVNDPLLAALSDEGRRYFAFEATAAAATDYRLLTPFDHPSIPIRCSGSPTGVHKHTWTNRVRLPSFIESLAFTVVWALSVRKLGFETLSNSV